MRLTLSIVALVLAYATTVYGQPGQPRDKVAAQALFDEGRALLKAGNIEAACTKFEGSQRMNPQPGTLLNLASCHEQLGRLATAWGEYREALALARADRRADRVAFAEKRLAELEPRLPRLVIDLSPASAAAEGIEVLRDGVVLDAAALGTSLPIDPGTHVIVASAPGFLAFRVVVEAREAEVTRVRIEGLERAPVTPTPEPTAEPPPVPAAPPPRPSPPAPTAAPEPLPLSSDGDPSALRTSGWVTVALGTVAAVAGLGTVVMALREDTRATELGCDLACPTDEALEHSEAARRAAIATAVLLPLSAALTGAGIVMVTVSVAPDSRSAAVSLGGRF